MLVSGGSSRKKASNAGVKIEASDAGTISLHPVSAAEQSGDIQKGVEKVGSDVETVAAPPVSTAEQTSDFQEGVEEVGSDVCSRNVCVEKEASDGQECIKVEASDAGAEEVGSDAETVAAPPVSTAEASGERAEGKKRKFL